MARFARYWLPALLWTAAVLYASSDAFSAANTGSILDALVTAVYGPVQAQTFQLLHLLVRKSAHFTEYGMLGVFWFHAWRGARGGYQWRWSLAAIAAVLVTALADEIHQSMVPSRTGSPWDVLLDVVGALTLQIALRLWLLREQPKWERLSGAAE